MQRTGFRSVAAAHNDGRACDAWLRRFAGGAAAISLVCAATACARLAVVPAADLRDASKGSPSAEWPHYGRDAGGSRYSPLAQITRENVAQLEIAWTYHTGEPALTPRRGSAPSLQATPLMIEGTLFISTPLGKVMALDPATGRERWRFDAAVAAGAGWDPFANRGVATWLDTGAPSGSLCRRRIYLAALDARLIALDATTGRPCSTFGNSGTVDLREGLRIAPIELAAYSVTSPPTVVNDLVITGSGIWDNTHFAPASGEVRAFDARTGALRWTWHPIPQDSSDQAWATWWDGSAARTGGGNVWSVIVSDSSRDLVFLPTTSPAPDYYGGNRLGENRYTNSVVALRASTGALVWHFQTVHHDLWDFDNAAPPALANIVRDGLSIPAVLQATKTGMLFVLHRETGEPLFPVQEREVPGSTVPGEQASPTQPFTALTPALSPHAFGQDDVWGPTPTALAACREAVAALRNNGVFTPPSLEGTLVIPSNIGGAHWGGVAADGVRGIAVVPVNRVPAMVQLIPAEGFDIGAASRESDRLGLGYQYTRMRGTPYVMRRRILLGPGGIPCSRPPFGALVAVSLRTGEKLWEAPLGSLLPARDATGSLNLGGPIVTAGGVVFIAATLDRAIHAFDVETGRQLWRASLPAGGRATPMTYESAGRQFVVVAAGGGGPFGTGDAFVAFALPR